MEKNPEVVDLAAPTGTGPLWGTASADLNATLLAWGAGEGTPEHVNGERDVIVVVDGRPHPIGGEQALLVEKGRSRRIEAGRDGIRYLSVHLRRHGLQLGRFG